ncbi:MAG TPA: FlgD immunoglobulin-like domain containing protein [Gaiellaceae bacterium]|nr:FlgD immunoglobulin-like domain containing protein [Gaiellaceae bacterium]
MAGRAGAHRRWLTLLALGLLAFAVAAFTYTEVLKLEPKPVTRAQVDRWLSPECGCPQASAAIRFQLREAQRLDVTVEQKDGDAVRTLAADRRFPAGTVLLSWDGRDDAGQVVADGAFRVHVRLLEERRTIELPKDLTVDTAPPRATLLGVSPATLPPGTPLEVRYRASEPALAVLLVDGEEVLRSRLREAGARVLRWDGLVAGVPPAAGTRFVAVELVDRAGNVSDRTDPVAVTVTGR